MGKGVARRPTLSLLGRFLPLLGFLPEYFGLSYKLCVFVGPSGVDNGGVMVVTFWWVSACLCVCV